MSFVFVFIGLQVLELLLLKWGLKLPLKFFEIVVLVFVIFCLRLPYLAWLISHARQPSYWPAALFVRPAFAWQFNWLAFLVLIGPMVVLMRIGSSISGSEMVITIIRCLVAVIIGFWGLVTLYGLATASRPPQVTTLELKIAGLAKKDDGIRLVQFTDPHLSWWTSTEESQDIARIVAGLKPDLLAITGDLVDQNPQYTNILIDLLKDIQPRLGKFAIIGNHDVYTGREEIASLMARDGFTMLRHNWVSLQDKGADMVIGGMDDSGIGWTGPDPDEKYIPEILKNFPKGLPIIWLGHRPTSFDRVIGLPVALTLSGHTHGGQLRLPFGGPGLADIAFKHAMGLYKVGDQMLYVSRGTGTVGWPFRIACPEEVTLIILRAP